MKDPKANFRNAFDGTGAATVYGTTNALTKVWFSYAGYENAFNVVNEVRVCGFDLMLDQYALLIRLRTLPKP